MCSRFATAVLGMPVWASTAREDPALCGHEGRLFELPDPSTDTERDIELEEAFAQEQESAERLANTPAAVRRRYFEWIT